MLSKCCRKATVSDKEDIALLVRRKRGTWYHAFNAGSGVTFLSAPVEPSATIFPGRAARIAPELHREPAITAMRSGTSLNAFVEDAIRQALSHPVP